MTKTNTNKLIEELTRDLKPTKRKGWLIPCISWCLILTIFAFINYHFLSDFLISYKNSIYSLIANPIFVVGILTSVSSFFYAIFASLPGRNIKIWKIMSYIFFILWGVIILIRMIIEKDFQFHLKDFYHCGTGTLISTATLFLILFIFIKRRFLLDIESAILGGVLASSISGTLCIGFICQMEEPAHIFYTHYLPVVFLFLVAYSILFIKYKYF